MTRLIGSRPIYLSILSCFSKKPPHPLLGLLLLQSAALCTIARNWHSEYTVIALGGQITALTGNFLRSSPSFCALQKPPICPVRRCLRSSFQPGRSPFDWSESRQETCARGKVYYFLFVQQLRSRARAELFCVTRRIRSVTWSGFGIQLTSFKIRDTPPQTMPNMERKKKKMGPHIGSGKCPSSFPFHSLFAIFPKILVNTVLPIARHPVC